jgi:hypothetical protein
MRRPSRRTLAVVERPCPLDIMSCIGAQRIHVISRLYLRADPAECKSQIPFEADGGDLFDFSAPAYDQMIHDVALQNLPVMFVIDRAWSVAMGLLSRAANTKVLWTLPREGEHARGGYRESAGRHASSAA